MQQTFSTFFSVNLIEMYIFCPLNFTCLDLADQWFGSVKTVSLQRHFNSGLYFVTKVCFYVNYRCYFCSLIFVFEMFRMHLK